MYKKAVGSLYKRKIILITNEGIRLQENDSAQKQG